MAIKRFLPFSARAPRDVTTGENVDHADGTDVINRTLRFGQRAWTTFTVWAGSPSAALLSENASAEREARDQHDGARHLDIGGYFQADHTWAGGSQETAPLENVFDHGPERIFDRYGPH